MRSCQMTEDQLLAVIDSTMSAAYRSGCGQRR
jgi:hypothetical protein